MLNRFLHSLRSVEMTKRAVGMTVLLLLLAGQGSAWATEKTVTDPVSANHTGVATRSLTNTIALNVGWNWVSFNVEATLEDLKAALVEALPGNSMTIKSQTQQTQYNPNTGRWKGSLNWGLAQMYMINVTSDCEITLEGSPIDPAEHPVTISGGECWIAFPFNEQMTVADAFAGFAVSGDIIVSQSAFAFCTGNTWRGTLTTLEPGQGYIYHSATNEGRTLTFPVPSSQTSSGSAATPQYESHWSDFYYHNYQYNSPVVAAIQVEGEYIVSGSNWAALEVAAFVGDECRGHAFLANYSDDFGDPYPIIELPVYYNSAGETVTFKLYDHANLSQCALNSIRQFNNNDELTIYTGENHLELYNDYESSVILSFIDAPQEVTLSGYPHDGLYWATFYCGYARYTLPEGAQAYTMDADFHLYRLGTDGRTIPEDLAVVIISDKQSITLTRDSGTSEIDVHGDENILRGSDSPVTVSSISGAPHVLGVVGEVFGFHPFTGDSIPANKAYYVQ